jgi:nucleoside-diphosphate-sugar epimerase
VTGAAAGRGPTRPPPLPPSGASPRSGCKRKVKPVNLGNPGEFTIRQLAEKVIELTGSRSKLVFKPLPVDDPMQRKPDIRLAKKVLGWQPKVPLNVGLEKTIVYFDRLLAAKKPSNNDAKRSR